MIVIKKDTEKSESNNPDFSEENQHAIKMLELQDADFEDSSMLLSEVYNTESSETS